MKLNQFWSAVLAVSTFSTVALAFQEAKADGYYLLLILRILVSLPEGQFHPVILMVLT